MVVRMRHTRSATKERRGGHNRGTKRPRLNKCAHCGEAVLPHRVCPHCGYYGARQVVDIAAQAAKAAAKKKARAAQ